MKKRVLTFWLSGALGAAAMAGAINAPAEVLANLDFFSDFELLSNLEILEDEQEPRGLIAVSTAAAVVYAATAAPVSTGAVIISTFTGRSYEKR